MTTTTKNNNRLLIAVLALQGLTLLGQWTGQPSYLQPAGAAVGDIPDPGSQRLQMVDELKGVNARLDRLVSLLESGQLKVRTEAAEGDKAGGAR